MFRRLRFDKLDVFTATRFLGNPLAIVHVPPSQSLTLSQNEKQIIAREFNLSETVFLHEPASDAESLISIDIFTTTDELPFAGHPTVGTGAYLLSKHPDWEKVTLRTKAGDIPVVREAGKVRLQVPIDFKTHEPFVHPTAKKLQPKLNNDDYVNGADGAEAVASIVKGMTFILCQLSSESALSRLQPYPEKQSVPREHLGEWAGFVGLYAFFEREDGILRTRMLDGVLEDPATGSAASTLAGWLAQRKGPGTWQIEIVQGVEIGRKSEITVIVNVDNQGEVQKIELEGAAVEVMQGWLDI